MPALQHTFDRQLADAKHRPTVGMDGAKHLLDFNEDLILSLISDRTLSFAWHIGLGFERREVRILRVSIDHYIAHGSKPHALTEAQALALLLPPAHAKPFLTNGEVQRALNCTSDHVLHLVEAGDLALMPGTQYGRGPAGSALITVPSFQNFITARRLP